MSTFRILVQIISLFAIFKVAASIPVPLMIGIDHNDPHMDNVKDALAAQTQANTMLSNALKLIDNPAHQDRDDILATCFGLDYDTKIKNIRNTMEKMASMSTMLDLKDASGILPDSLGVPADAEAVWESAERKLYLSSNFYLLKNGPKADKTWGLQIQAGILIHETVHAVLDVSDYFIRNTLDNRPAGSALPALCGYIHKDFASIRRDGKAFSLHLNPDSYRLLAHLATNGLHTQPPWLKAGCG